MPRIRFRDYICGGLGDKDDQKMSCSAYYLKLEQETIRFEDSGGLSKSNSGTPLIPYTEPSFENEGIKEKTIDDVAVETPKVVKKRSRKEFEQSYASI